MSAQLETITGVIRFGLNNVSLTERLADSTTRQWLLVIDRPPVGVIDASDIAAAASFVHNILGKNDGDQITLLGFRGNLAQRLIFQIVRVPN
jgi:hypothetical protein